MISKIIKHSFQKWRLIHYETCAYGNNWGAFTFLFSLDFNFLRRKSWHSRDWADETAGSGMDSRTGEIWSCHRADNKDRCFWSIRWCSFYTDTKFSEEFTTYIFRISIYLKDWNSIFLRNVVKGAWDYKGSYPKIQLSLHWIQCVDSPRSHSGSLGSIPDDVMWDLWRTNCRCGALSQSTSVSTANFHFIKCSTSLFHRKIDSK
jgi:hypothetical protein